MNEATAQATVDNCTANERSVITSGPSEKLDHSTPSPALTKTAVPPQAEQLPTKVVSPANKKVATSDVHMKRSKHGNTATQRLRQDYIRLMKDPVPYITAAPLPNNILEWHYVVEGPKDSPYSGGYYHGKLVFPNQYPFKPPSIYIITPNGRFKTNTRLCLSISDFHPDTWNPAWSVGTILTGLLSFMLESSPTLGSVETSDQTKRHFAVQSLEHNIKDPIFKEVFPQLFQKISSIIKQKEEELERATAGRLSNGALSGAGTGGNNAAGMNGVAGAGGNAHGFAGGYVGALTNIGVLLGFAAFSMIVKYVWKLVLEDEM